MKNEFIERDDFDEIIEDQSKLNFIGLNKSYTNYDSYIFEQNDVPMDKQIYSRFAVLELSKLLMYETLYDEFQSYFGEEIYNYTVW